MNPLIQLKKAAPVFLVAVAFFGLLPATRAVSPPPDGGYPGANTAEGENALFSLTTGTGNTASGHVALFNNTTGSGNTATGSAALLNNTTGSTNTATGEEALLANTTGTQNTATGVFALFNNQGANNNAADGFQALVFNTGNQNTATGAFALNNNTTANNNTADGFQALLNNSTGKENTAVGESALKHNITANDNTADGFQALFNNSTGANNTAVGHHALFGNSTGSNNIAFGRNAGNNLTIGNNNIDIGTGGTAGESNTIRIGSAQTRTFIKGISVAVVSGAPVAVNAAGQVGVTASSRRFKDQIKAMNKVSEALLALKPVTFRYNKQIDPERIPQFGLVAEDVEKINPDLVIHDSDGKPYTVRYEAVNAMLLNEFLKEHRTVQELKSTVAKQEETILQQKKDFQAIASQQQKQIEALIAGLQKVSVQLEASKPAPQVVNNP
jgi:hypothetical protein